MADLGKYLDSLNSLLDDFHDTVMYDESIHDIDFRNKFLSIRLKFESLTDTLDYRYTDHDFDVAVSIVKKMGYVSIANLSRSLNLRYNQCFAMVLRMEELKIITKPINGIRRFNKG